MSDAQLLALSDYQSSDLFDEEEKMALLVTDAMTREPVDLEDERFEELRRHFGDAQLVELAAHVGLANFRSRLNAFFHVQAHGLCPLPIPVSGGGHG